LGSRLQESRYGMGKEEEQAEPEFAVVVQIGDLKTGLGVATAREVAESMSELFRLHPHSSFHFVMFGYDNDVRDIWYIPEAAEYVRLVFELVGLTADHPMIPRIQPMARGFLSCCGVFGPEIQKEALAINPPAMVH
jgi:hypothetical protein